MTTREWVNTIPEVNRKKLTVYSDLIQQATEKSLSDNVNEYAKKMRGYLECMKDCGIISEIGLKTLYLYYRSVRVEWLISQSDRA